MTATASYAHLVGSVPLPDTESVFRSLCAELGPHLRRIPDGETGDRLHWIWFQRQVLLDHPDIEIDPDARLNEMYHREGVPHRDAPYLRLRPGADPDSMHIPTGYADVACASYAVFSRLRDEGVIGPETRFQVSLPTPISTAYSYVTPASRAAFIPAYERALLVALGAIARSIPHDQLSIQWDVCHEVLIFEDFFSGRPVDYKEQIFDLLGRLGNAVPETVDMGYHLCYGTPPPTRPVVPQDIGRMVEIGNGVCERLDRRLDFLHIPTPKDRTDAAYFQPLRQLNLPDSAELFLGLISPDDVEGDTARIAAARAFAPNFGVATECGWGRHDPSRVSGLLASHRHAVDLLNRPD